MTEVPLAVAIVVAFFILGGAVLTFLGCVGLLRFKNTYERLHATTLGTSFGAIGVALASAVYFSFVESRLVIHEGLVVAFIVLTTPVTLMLLAQAALHRDRARGKFGPDHVAGQDPG